MLAALACGLGLLEVVLGLLPSFWSFTAMLLCCGFVAQMFLPLANSTVQLWVPAWQRGRIMAVYAIAVVGAYPIGSLAIGWLTQAAGPRIAIVAGARLGSATGLLSRDAHARRGLIDPLTWATLAIVFSVSPSCSRHCSVCGRLLLVRVAAFVVNWFHFRRRLAVLS